MDVGEMPLGGKQRRHLRGLGHSLKAVVQVGKEGVSEAVTAAADAALAEHELIKIKLGQGAAVGRDDAAEQLAEATTAEVAQILGKTILLYRPRPAKDKRPRIKLP
jgi:RNA-binding protein